METIINSLLQEYRALNLHNIKDYDLFNNIAIIHHSSSIEGSTLTLTDSELLIAEGLTPKGKPLQHTLMVKDHYEALLFTLDLASNKGKELNIRDIQEINAKVNKNTGGIVNSTLGSVDVAKGEFRKNNVRAGDTYFVNYDKVPTLTSRLVKEINENINLVKTDNEKLELSFAAHFNLVSIHPFMGGNDWTSRLLMNFLQQKFNLPLSIVYQEDKVDYINALKESRKDRGLNHFYDFMFQQYKKYLTAEIGNARKLVEKASKSNQKHRGLSFVL
ncbi:Fic family protein [Arachidicoccus sp.]|uniref:Fic family protein n=1 Tax=Arachidicoccus sp. TaxID=1872624 RepID=UPI003D211AA6